MPPQRGAERFSNLAPDHSRNRALCEDGDHTLRVHRCFRASESCIATDVALSGSVRKLVNKSFPLRFLPSAIPSPSAKSLVREAFALQSATGEETTMAMNLELHRSDESVWDRADDRLNWDFERWFLARPPVRFCLPASAVAR